MILILAGIGVPFKFTMQTISGFRLSFLANFGYLQIFVVAYNPSCWLSFSGGGVGVVAHCLMSMPALCFLLQTFGV